MTDKIKDPDWDAQQFRIYAEQELARLESEIEANSALVQGLSTRVYRDPAMGKAFLELAERTESDLRNTTDALKIAPDRLGRIQDAYFGRLMISEEARGDARRLSVALERQRDLIVGRERFERLRDKAGEAERQPAQLRREAVPDLRAEREYCDVTRDTRMREHAERAARDWPPEPERGGGGGSPPAGGQGGGGAAGGSPSRSWWRGEAKEQDPVREERREPEAAQRRWWREEKPTQEEEPEREREPDREDDRFKR